MDLRTRLLFNVEVLHLKAMFEGNTSQTANEYQQVLSYLTNNNVTTAFQMQDIPAGKKTRSIIRYIIENRRDYAPVTEFVRFLRDHHDLVLHHRILIDMSPYWRLRFNIRFMQKLTEIFYPNDSFKRNVYDHLNVSLQDPSVKARVESFSNDTAVEELVKDMKQWIDPNLDWDIDDGFYYVQKALVKIMLDIIMENKNYRQYDDWMRVAPDLLSRYVL